MANCLQVIPTWLSKLSGMSYRQAEKDPNKIKIVIIGFHQKIKSCLLIWVWKKTEHATPKCVTLACGLFWADGNQDLADKRKTFLSPLTAWKNLDRGPGTERQLLPDTTSYLKDSPAWQGKHLLFSSCELSSSPLKLQVPIPFLSSGWHYKPQLPDCKFKSHIFMYKIKCGFFPGDLPYIHLIIRLAKEPRRVEGKLFHPKSDWV